MLTRPVQRAPTIRHAASVTVVSIPVRTRSRTRCVTGHSGATSGRLTRLSGREETLAALRFRWPVYGPISSDFGAPRASRTGFHAGVDIGASRGTFVRAPAGGTVAFVGWRSGYGRTIVIDHGHQISTLYGHLAKPDVVRGQTVEEGAGIGLIGATGHASGPHLHYEVLVNGRPVNPRLVFARPQDIYGRSWVAARENPSGQREATPIPSSTDAASVRLGMSSGGSDALESTGKRPRPCRRTPWSRAEVRLVTPSQLPPPRTRRL